MLDPSLPAGRRREIDNVMKKARAASQGNGYWDKKLLEVEAKDPNRYVKANPKESTKPFVYFVITFYTISAGDIAATNLFTWTDRLRRLRDAAVRVQDLQLDEGGQTLLIDRLRREDHRLQGDLRREV